ncbi:MAG TPA: phage protease [Verrucomicrobiae bacterium]|jgi:hypothetical protein|nr:phage protease [Verrucomicrobiae bacterium]
MSTRIFNREFVHPADGWYQIETPGEHPNAKGGVVQVIDAAAISSIVNRFNQDASDYARKHGVPFPGMLIDHEHFRHDLDKETRAYGWLLKMENRNGIPFGEIRWTGVGQQSVDDGEYRFFSSEYDPEDLVRLGGDKVRPMRLAGLTLTNQPNNVGGQPITNRAVGLINRDGQPDDTGQPAPALFDWFDGVKRMYKGLMEQSCYTLSYQQAWDLCKQQHPDLYAAAFFGDEATDDSEPNAKAAAADVANLVNRIRVDSGGNFEFAWNFVREKLPRIFNRQTRKPAPVLNREKENGDARAVQSKAAKLFGRLANQEQLATKSDFAAAWKRIINREPVLHSLANGRCTPEDAFAREPALRNRLA